jgi:hypothetical protein
MGNDAAVSSKCYKNDEREEEITPLLIPDIQRRGLSFYFFLPLIQDNLKLTSPPFSSDKPSIPCFTI